MAGSLERAFWNGYALSYDSLAKHFLPYCDLVTEVCDRVDDYAAGRRLRVLDAGCGTGNYSWELTRRGHEVVGVDASTAMLKRAESKRCAQADYPRFLQLDLMAPLPFETGEFDAVVSSMVIYAVPSPDVMLRELRRVVAEGAGFVLVTTQNDYSVGDVVRETVRGRGVLRGLWSLRPLVAVGAYNLLIDRGLAKGNYTMDAPDAFATRLESTGFDVDAVSTTYVGDCGVLATGTAR